MRACLRVLLTACMVFLSGSFAYAQNGQLPPMAAITNQTVTLYGLGGGPQAVFDGQGRSITNLTWSPDGQHLAFTTFDANYNPQIMLTDRAGSAPVVLASGVSSMPPTFTPDSSQIVYAVEDWSNNATPGEDGLPRVPVRVLSQGLSPDAVPQEIGRFSFGVGCGGGSPFPMDGVYNMESGFGGKALIFTWTDAGILFSGNCAGVGLGLLDTASSEATMLSGDVSRVRVSPDGRRAAGVQGAGLVVFDLATHTAEPVSTQAAPDQMAWGDNNTIFYSVRNLMGAPLPLSAQEADAVRSYASVDPGSIPQYMAVIYRRELGGGESQVFNGPGWAVGRMFASQGSLYFSLIPNGESWVEALANNQIDFTNPQFWQQEYHTVAVTLLRMPLGGGGAIDVGNDIGAAALHPSGV